MKAQTGTEFLLMTSLSLLFFAVVLLMYYNNITETANLTNSMTANELCLNMASTINAIAAMPGNSTYPLNLSNQYNYTIWIAANSVHINYAGALYACRLEGMNISNATGSTTFQMMQNATLVNNGGVIVVG